MFLVAGRWQKPGAIHHTWRIQVVISIILCQGKSGAFWRLSPMGFVRLPTCCHIPGFHQDLVLRWKTAQKQTGTDGSPSPIQYFALLV